MSGAECTARTREQPKKLWFQAEGGYMKACDINGKIF